MKISTWNGRRIVLGCLASLVIAAGSSVLMGQPAELKQSERLNLGLKVTGTLVGEPELEGRKKAGKLPAAGVSVSLLDENRKVLKQATTDRYGIFRFDRLKGGEYQVCWQDRAWGKGCVKPFKLTKSSKALEAIQLDSSQFVEFELTDRFRDILDHLGLVNRCNANGNPRFLNKRRNSSDEDAARERLIGENYYRAIDPFSQRLTLKDWWVRNGFDPVTGRAPAEANGFKAGHTSYLNDNDLGFGRDMHCLKRTSNVSCWVANHGQADQDLGNADLAAAQENPGATVVMEYTQLPQNFKVVSAELRELIWLFNGGDRSGFDKFGRIMQPRKIVTFYVYAPNPASPKQSHGSFERVVEADLDGCGEKFVPGLCLNCHGGDVPIEIANGSRENWTTDDLLEVGAASFREFDHPTFKLPGGRSNANNVEEAVFHRLNKLVLTTNPASGIEELINGWYANSKVMDQSYAPPGWQNAPAIYTNIVGRYCRTCHVAFEEFRNWNTEAELYSLNYYLCDEQSMPHAAVTYFNMSEAERTNLLVHYGEAVCN